MSGKQELALGFGVILALYFVVVTINFFGNDPDTRGWRRMMYFFGFALAALCAVYVIVDG